MFAKSFLIVKVCCDLYDKIKLSVENRVTLYLDSERDKYEQFGNTKIIIEILKTVNHGSYWLF